MFPETHLTVNEVEKMAVGEKIKFCQIPAMEQGGKKKKKKKPKPGEVLIDEHPTLCEFYCGVHCLRSEAAAELNSCLALCSDLKTIQKSGNPDEGLVRANAAGICG